MKRVHELYSILRKELFNGQLGKRQNFVDACFLPGANKTPRMAACILQAWIDSHPDEVCSQDYWTSKWFILKRVLVGGRKGETLESIVSNCIALAKYDLYENCAGPCYEDQLMKRWA